MAAPVRCLVAETRAMYVLSPVEQMDSLIRFLAALLDPRRPGSAFVRSREALGLAGGVDGWLSGDAAMAWLSERAAQWREYARVLAEHGSEVADDGTMVAERVFDQLSEPENVARVFLDDRRLADCVGGPLAASPRPTYYVITSDWSYYDETMSWCPQVVAMTDWPTSRLLGPRPLAPTAAPRLDATEAAAMLDDTLYDNIGRLTAIRRDFQLPYHFHSFPTADLLRQIELSPPVFYGAFVGGISSATDLLAEPGEVTIRTLAQTALGMDRIDSRGLTAGIIDKRFLTYRREIVGRQSSRAYYLALAADRSDELGLGTDLSAVDEDRFVHIADQLAYLNSVVAQNVTNVAPRLLDRIPQLAISNASLERADEITQDLRESAMLLRLSSGSRQRIGTFMQDISLAFTESASGVSKAIVEAEQAKAVWDEAVEAISQALLERLGSDNLPGQDPATGPKPLASVRSYVAVADVDRLAQHVREEGAKLQTRHEQTRAGWQAMVEYVRGVDRERNDQQNRMIGFGLAGVALLTAAPLLVGSLGGEELRAEVESWTGGLGLLGRLLTAAHTPLLAASVVGAIGVAAFLIIQLGRTALGSIARDPSLVPMGEVCRRAWENNRRAEQAVLRLHQVAPSERPVVLAALDQLDAALCADLVRLFEHLQELQRRAARPARPLDRIANRIRAYALWQELFQKRPIPLWTPRASLLYRYKSQEIAAVATVSLSEVDSLLRLCGWDQADRERADALAREAATRLDPPALVAHLGRIGVVPSQTGWVDEPEENAPAGAGSAGDKLAVGNPAGGNPAGDASAAGDPAGDAWAGPSPRSAPAIPRPAPPGDRLAAVDRAALFDKSGPISLLPRIGGSPADPPAPR